MILRRIPGVDPQGHFNELVSNTGTDATTYTDDTVSAETRYTYRIKAINEHGVSERSRWSHIDVPAAPEAVEGDDPDGEGDGGGAPGGPGKKANVSEPSGDDFPGSTSTTGEVDVGGSVTGTIEPSTDKDWFKVELEAGKTYQFDVEGSDTGRGTLPDPAASLYATSLIRGNDDAGVGKNARIINTPTATGTYYVVAYSSTSDTGTYTVSVIVLGANGASEADTDFPETTATTGRVEVGASATGNLSTVTDVDWFKVVLDAGKTYQIDMKGLDGGGGTIGDPYLHDIRDSSGTGISNTENDDVDADNDIYDSQITFTPTTAGAYYLVAAGAADSGTYTLSVSGDTPAVLPDDPPADGSETEEDDLPADATTNGALVADGYAARAAIAEPVFVERTGDDDVDGYTFDTDWFVVDLKAGRTYRIDMKGATPGDDELTLRLPEIEAIYDADSNYLPNTSSRDATDHANSSHHLARVEFTPDADGTYYIAATGESFEAGSYELRVIDITQDDDEHPADRSTTVLVVVGTSVTGKIDFNRDVDWFKLLISVEDRYQIDLEGQETGSGSLRDPLLLGVYDADGNYISGTRNDDGGEGYNARISRTLKVGIYYVAVGAFGNGEGTYTLTVVY